jgi:hypothetical protein
MVLAMVRDAMSRYFFSALFCFSLACGAPAAAQTGDAGCRDIRGTPVGLVMDNAIADLAFATMIDGVPIILYSPALERAVAPPTGLFVYAHECGHQALGHLLHSATLDREQEADCWAINLIYRNALVDDGGLRVIERDIRQFAVGDATHLPGPVRAQALDACLRQGDRLAQEKRPLDQPGKVAPSGQAISDYAAGLSNAFARQIGGSGVR